jgi:Leucine-rich repeat (LRR) protein
MKKTLIPMLLAIAHFASPLAARSQAINVTDSLALVDLYNSTHGPAWTKHTNWLTTQPVTTWYGIYSYGLGRVNIIALNENNLSGSLPASIGNLSDLGGFEAMDNNLTGSLPASMTNFANVANIDLQYNQLSGPIPNFSIQDFIFLDHNNYSFADLEPFNMPYTRNSCYPQADLPLLQNGSTDTAGFGKHDFPNWALLDG